MEIEGPYTGALLEPFAIVIRVEELLFQLAAPKHPPVFYKTCFWRMTKSGEQRIQ